MDITNKKLAQVRALLAKAESTDHPAEAELLRAKAMELIARHGIDEAMVGAESGKPGSADVADVRLTFEAPFAMEKVVLWDFAIGQNLGIQSILVDDSWRDGGYKRAGRGDRKVKVIHSFGRAADLERAQLLFTSLLLHQGTELARAQASYTSWHESGQDKAAYSRSWLQSYAHTIRARLAELVASQVRAANQDARDHGKSTGAELVLADRDAAVLERFTEKYPHIVTSRRSGSSGTGGRDGAEAGSRADLGGKRVGTGAAGVLG